jgi:hypothetical protein
MKKCVNNGLALVLAAVLFLVSCSKSPVDPVVNSGVPSTADSVTTSLTTGTWIISSFTQKTEDKTSKFDGFTFIFSADGSLSATIGGTETKGTWHFTRAVTYYGSTSKSAVALNLGAANPLSQLTKTWNFVSATSTLLKVDSPELAGDEHVQFSRK